MRFQLAREVQEVYSDESKKYQKEIQLNVL